MADDARLRRFPAETIILREGECNTTMFKILSGHAELYVGYGTPRESFIGIIGEQACFGEFGLLLGKPSIYTVIAYSDILALSINENDLDGFIKSNYASVIGIMRNMANSMLAMRVQSELLMEELEHSQKNGNIDIQRKIGDARRVMKQYALNNAFYREMKAENRDRI